MTGRLALAAVLVLAACTTPEPVGTVLTGPTAKLLTLTVAVEDTGAHYDRDDWGSWTTVRGCDTRERVLARDGTDEIVDDQCRPGCPAALHTPCWTSPYDGRTTADPDTLDIDHIVALAEAQQSGARDWTAVQRHGYANDPTNLVAVTAAVNRSKGDQDPGTWLPAKWRCEYAARWIGVKATYGLTVDQAERDALAGVLAGCPPAGAP